MRALLAITKPLKSYAAKDISHGSIAIFFPAATSDVAAHAGKKMKISALSQYIAILDLLRMRTGLSTELATS
jgi:hypothetical protein